MHCIPIIEWRCHFILGWCTYHFFTWDWFPASIQNFIGNKTYKIHSYAQLTKHLQTIIIIQKVAIMCCNNCPFLLPIRIISMKKEEHASYNRMTEVTCGNNTQDTTIFVFSTGFGCSSMMRLPPRTHLNSSPHWTKLPPFRRRCFPNAFSWMKTFIFW